MEMIAATEHLALAPPTAVGWVAYIIIGGLAGWLAGKLVKGGGQGILLNILTGVVGGFLGGFLLEKLGVDVIAGRWWFTFFTALIGAAILLWVVSLVTRSTRRR
jgi:uncharacterized membrane protein YeaQ/YmgE (transglycosylase-associated protein family)